MEQPDGGANPYASFSSPLAAIPIAIGVWLECAVDPTAVSTDRSAGFNVYVALCGNTTELSYARNGGMRVLFQSDPAWTPAFPADDVSAGYMIGDEWDMTHPPSDCLGAWVSQHAMFPGDGRMRYANFGKGVAYWNSNSQAACWVNSVDVPSADVYWFSDSNACGPGEAGGEPGVYTQNNCHVAANYGWLVNRVRSLVAPTHSKPVWSFVENNCPFGDEGWPCITGAEMRAAVWHSLIAGARGVVYFNHSFKANAANGCDDSFHTIRECAPVRAAVTNTNAEVQSFASVLNARTLTGGMQATGNVKAMGKWDGRNFYVFAGATPGAGSAQFAIPCVGNASATVAGEGRSLPVSAGSFSDNFADANAVHIYRIDGGSRCGL
jgi:hypothetical protein